MIRDYNQVIARIISRMQNNTMKQSRKQKENDQLKILAISFLSIFALFVMVDPFDLIQIDLGTSLITLYVFLKILFWWAVFCLLCALLACLGK